MAFITDLSVTQQLFSVILVLITSWLFLKWRCQTLPRGTRLPPCLPSVPVLGSLPFLRNDLVGLHLFLTEQAKTYGSVFGVYLGSKYAVILNGYDSIREALHKKSTYFSDRTTFYYVEVFNPNRKGIESARYNDDFRKKVKIYLNILKEFGFGKHLMETRINEEVADFVNQARLTAGNAFNPEDMIHLTVINIIINILLGRRYPHGHRHLRDIREAVKEFLRSFVEEVEFFRFLRFVPPYRGRIQRHLNSYKTYKKILVREIDFTLAEIDKEPEGERKNESFVRRLVETMIAEVGNVDKRKPLREANIDWEEVYETVMSLIGGADDATSLTLLWGFAELANRPDIQRRVHQELDEVVGSDRQPLLADESRMPYTQAVILETLRRRTLLPLLSPRETTSDTQLGDYFIPKKTMVIPNIYSAQMDPKTWSEPEKFQPERFIDEHGRITGKEGNMAFSLGKRSCTGESLARQELFLFLAGILQKFDILPPEGQQNIVVQEQMVMLLVPVAYKIRLVARQR